MSAYVVSDKHVNVLVTFFAANLSHTYYDREGVAHDLSDPAVAQQFAQLLKDQCIKSVQHRYPYDTLATLPGPNGLKPEIEFQRTNGYKPVEIIKACSCFDYQACEDPHYDLTEAHGFIEAIRHRAIQSLPEYDNARGWDISDEDPEPIKPIVAALARPVAAKSVKTVKIADSIDHDSFYNVEVTPRQSIRLYGVKHTKSYDLTFKIGDRAVYDSYNLTYVGTITAIGEKTVTIRHYPDSPKASRLALADFAWRNWDFDADKIAHDNSVELQNI